MDQTTDSPTDRARAALREKAERIGAALLERGPAKQQQFLAIAEAFAESTDPVAVLRRKLAAWGLAAQVTAATALVMINRGQIEGPDGQAIVVALERLAWQHEELTRELAALGANGGGHASPGA